MFGIPNIVPTESYVGLPAARVVEQLVDQNPGCKAFLFLVTHDTGAGQIACAAGNEVGSKEFVRALTSDLEPVFNAITTIPAGVVFGTGDTACPQPNPLGSTQPTTFSIDFIRLPLDDALSCVVAIARSTKSGEAGREAIVAGLEAIAPQMRQFVLMQLEGIRWLRVQAGSMLEALSEPAFLCSRNLAILSANTPAQRYYEETFGQSLDEAGPLALPKLSEGVLMDTLANLEAESKQFGFASFVDPNGTFILAKLFRHVPPGFEHIFAEEQYGAIQPVPYLLVNFRIARRVMNSIPLEAIRAFGITRAEGRLLEGLMGGRTMPEIAHDNSVSYNTVRNQFASLTQKTGLRTQADVIRFFSSLS